MNTRTSLVNDARREIARGNSAKAVRMLLPHVRANPTDVEALSWLGHAAYDTKDYGQAEATYRTMWSLAPQDFRAMYGMGVTLMALGRHEEARSWLSATLVTNPEFERAAVRLAKLETPSLQAPAPTGSPTRRPNGADRPMTTLVMPEDDLELKKYRRASRERARIDMMNEHWYGIPWPIRVLQWGLFIVVLVGILSNR